MSSETGRRPESRSRAEPSRSYCGELALVLVMYWLGCTVHAFVYVLGLIINMSVLRSAGRSAPTAAKIRPCVVCLWITMVLFGGYLIVSLLPLATGVIVAVFSGA